MRSVRLFFLAVFTMFMITSCSEVCNDNILDKTPIEPPEDTVPASVPGDIIQDVHFAFDSAALSPVAKSTLQEAATWLKANANRVVVIEGHCDERGTVEYNLVLGEKRARSVYEYLRGLGIPARQMSTISYGEEFPLDPAHNESAWAKNRRAHFAVK
ncbi:MAG: peptidoglycan-associated lipoprotein Pal [Deltaproteobacteria bacterium]|jgi:peptidoglycan-associated lipoprotein|nr:peptidoglycan-associated lipoprotein Pal [Deltaproteobacteria bacterium]